MSRTGTDKETRGDEYCLERTDFETCRKSVWSPERRERLVSPIGDRLRVTRDRVMRKMMSQADRRRMTVTRKTHSKRKTRASIRTNPVLSKGHPQDVAHPATAKQAESDSETELYRVASLGETAHSQILLTESVTQEREQARSAPINNIRWVAKSDACALSWRGAPLRRRSMQGRNPIMLKMESNNYRSETATAVSDIIAEGAVGAVPGTETCAACQRTFTSKRGLSVHQRRAHPVEFHAAHQVEPRERPRWPAEERQRMAQMEANLLSSGIKKGRD